jgi:hypothetical protein
LFSLIISGNKSELYIVFSIAAACLSCWCAYGEGYHIEGVGTKMKRLQVLNNWRREVLDFVTKMETFEGSKLGELISDYLLELELEHLK